MRIVTWYSSMYSCGPWFRPAIKPSWLPTVKAIQALMLTLWGSDVMVATLMYAFAGKIPAAPAKPVTKTN